LLEKGDRVAVMLPNYMQSWGLARAYAGSADAFWLVENRKKGESRWELDVDSLKRAMKRKTRVVLVTNPNNPTGAVLSEEEMGEVVRAARKVGAWIVADEIYRGAESSGPMSPTFWGRHNKVIVTSGLSKAFGLPGLRLGWIVGPEKTLTAFRRYHDYTTLTPTYLSDRLARMIMEPRRRESILARTRSIIQDHLPHVERWIQSQSDIVSYVRPRAGAIAYFKFRLPVTSTAFMNELLVKHSVLVTPGDHFGGGKYIRVGFGYDADYTLKGLARIDTAMKSLRA
jgi:aspartate/methionine/tyrosine aminotransferase